MKKGFGKFDFPSPLLFFVPYYLNRFFHVLKSGKIQSVEQKLQQGVI